MPRCTCCDDPAPGQCDDHDTGYGVCERCLKKHGRLRFCLVNCQTHGPVPTIWNSDGTDGPVLICAPSKE